MGYWKTFEYHPAKKNVNNKRNRKQNVIWFNPSFSINVKAEIGVLNLLRKTFPYVIKVVNYSIVTPPK